MKSLSSLILFASITSCFSLNVYADTNHSVAQIDTTPPSAEGSLSPQQTQPMLAEAAINPYVSPTGGEAPTITSPIVSPAENAPNPLNQNSMTKLNRPGMQSTQVAAPEGVVDNTTQTGPARGMPGMPPQGMQGSQPGMSPQGMQGSPPGMSPQGMQGSQPGMSPQGMQGSQPGVAPQGMQGSQPGVAPQGMQGSQPGVAPQGMVGSQPGVNVAPQGMPSSPAAGGAGPQSMNNQVNPTAQFSKLGMPPQGMLSSAQDFH